MRTTILTLAVLATFGAQTMKGQTAMDIAADMVPGWNLGNTLEPGPCNWLSNELDYETAWQGTKTTQQVIDFVKAQGFQSIRIPCAWYVHMDANYNISPAWMDRVQEVVDYCIKDSLYVVLNDHYDNGWIERSFSTQTPESVSKNCFILNMMWKQIANRFRDYDHHLLFAGMNEPNAAGDQSHDKEADIATLIKYQQTFVNAVRQTGGHNATRVLVVQSPFTNIDLAYQYDVMPTDAAPNALMFEVHYYSPYNFTMMTKDESWGKQAYYWGEGNHVAGSSHNVTWGEEAYVQSQMRQMKTKYTSKGIPVIMGEFGALWRNMPQDEDQEKHDASIYAWYKTVCRYAVHNGIVPFVWDTNACQRPSMDILNRKNLTVFNQYALSGILDGCASVVWPYTGIESTEPDRCPASSKCYSLSGIPLKNAPRKGIYLKNGRKHAK
jgi:aryl-phospho-beta-D-glucosidase BglC (GH1 family)